jgi:hypothetical protein
MHAGQAGAWLHVPRMRITGECILWLRSQPVMLADLGRARSEDEVLTVSSPLASLGPSSFARAPLASLEPL